MFSNVFLKQIAEVSADPAEMEQEAEEEEHYYDYKPKYKDNAIEMLNKALNALRLESLHIKRNVLDPIVSREEQKKN